MNVMLPAGIRPYDREETTLSDPQLLGARQRLNDLMDGMIKELYANIPYGSHLNSSEEINTEYYRRFTVEIILRLRLKRVIDGLTIHYFAKNNPRLAKKWCSYTEDEMLHDGLFLSDLERMGMSRDEVYGTAPLLSTKLLQGYFYYGLEHEGVPLASLASSYFIEYTSSKTQHAWLTNVEKSLGAATVKGSMSHVDHDADDDHSAFVWDVLRTFIKKPEDVDRIEAHIHNVYHLFMMFFKELHAAVIQRNMKPFTGVYS